MYILRDLEHPCSRFCLPVFESALFRSGWVSLLLSSECSKLNFTLSSLNFFRSVFFNASDCLSQRTFCSEKAKRPEDKSVL